jgi:hypothetical protein
MARIVILDQLAVLDHTAPGARLVLEHLDERHAAVEVGAGGRSQRCWTGIRRPLPTPSGSFLLARVAVRLDLLEENSQEVIDVVAIEQDLDPVHGLPLGYRDPSIRSRSTRM